MELDAPLARQRDHAQRPKPRPERRHREVRQPKEARHRPQVADHRVDLLRADDGDGHDRRLRANRSGHKATPAEATQAVTLLEALARAARAFGEYEDQLVALQQPPRVVRVSDRLAGTP